MEVNPDEQARWGRHEGANKVSRRGVWVGATPTKGSQTDNCE